MTYKPKTDCKVPYVCPRLFSLPLVGTRDLFSLPLVGGLNCW